METSTNSVSKPLSSASKEKTTDSFEESGWTMYFEDFFANNNNEGHGSFSFADERTSIVSDAASLVVKKSADNEQIVGLPMDKRYKSLSLKKRRTKGVLIDDALEDTASSPVNTPMVKIPSPDHSSFLSLIPLAYMSTLLYILITFFFFVNFFFFM